MTMIGLYLIQQLNKLRYNGMLCDLDLVSNDGTNIAVHQCVFLALNKKQYLLEKKKQQQHGTSFIPARKKMGFPQLSSTDLRLVVAFMYGKPDWESNRYENLSAALEKLDMKYLLKEYGVYPKIKTEAPDNVNTTVAISLDNPTSLNQAENPSDSSTISQLEEIKIEVPDNANATVAMPLDNLTSLNQAENSSDSSMISQLEEMKIEAPDNADTTVAMSLDDTFNYSLLNQAENTSDSSTISQLEEIETEVPDNAETTVAISFDIPTSLNQAENTSDSCTISQLEEIKIEAPDNANTTVAMPLDNLTLLNQAENTSDGSTISQLEEMKIETPDNANATVVMSLDNPAFKETTEVNGSQQNGNQVPAVEILTRLMSNSVENIGELQAAINKEPVSIDCDISAELKSIENIPAGRENDKSDSTVRKVVPQRRLSSVCSPCNHTNANAVNYSIYNVVNQDVSTAESSSTSAALTSRIATLEETLKQLQNLVHENIACKKDQTVNTALHATQLSQQSDCVSKYGGGTADSDGADSVSKCGGISDSEHSQPENNVSLSCSSSTTTSAASIERFPFLDEIDEQSGTALTKSCLVNKLTNEPNNKDVDVMGIGDQMEIFDHKLGVETCVNNQDRTEFVTCIPTSGSAGTIIKDKEKEQPGNQGGKGQPQNHAEKQPQDRRKDPLQNQGKRQSQNHEIKLLENEKKEQRQNQEKGQRQNQEKEKSLNQANKQSQDQKEERSLPCKSYPSDWKDMQEKFASYLSKVRPIKPAGTGNQLQKCVMDRLVSKLNVNEKLRAKLMSTAPKTKIDEQDPNNGKITEKSSVPHDPNNGKINEKSSVSHDPNNGKINEKSSVPHDPSDGKITEKSSVPHDLNNGKINEKSSIPVSQHSAVASAQTNFSVLNRESVDVGKTLPETEKKKKKHRNGADVKTVHNAKTKGDSVSESYKNELEKRNSSAECISKHQNSGNDARSGLGHSQSSLMEVKHIPITQLNTVVTSALPSQSLDSVTPSVCRIPISPKQWLEMKSSSSLHSVDDQNGILETGTRPCRVAQTLPRECITSTEVAPNRKSGQPSKVTTECSESPLNQICAADISHSKVRVSSASPRVTNTASSAKQASESEYDHKCVIVKLAQKVKRGSQPQVIVYPKDARRKSKISANNHALPIPNILNTTNGNKEVCITSDPKDAPHKSNISAYNHALHIPKTEVLNTTNGNEEVCITSENISITNSSGTKAIPEQRIAPESVNSKSSLIRSHPTLANALRQESVMSTTALCQKSVAESVLPKSSENSIAKVVVSKPESSPFRAETGREKESIDISTKMKESQISEPEPLEHPFSSISKPSESNGKQIDGNNRLSTKVMTICEKNMKCKSRNGVHLAKDPGTVLKCPIVLLEKTDINKKTSVRLDNFTNVFREKSKEQKSDSNKRNENSINAAPDSANKLSPSETKRVGVAAVFTLEEVQTDKGSKQQQISKVVQSGHSICPQSNASSNIPASEILIVNRDRQSKNQANKPSQNQKEELSVPCKSYPSDWKDMQEKCASYWSKVRPIKPAGTVNQLQKCEKDTLVSKLNIHEKLRKNLMFSAQKTTINKLDPNNRKINEKSSVPHDPNNGKINEKSSVPHDPNNRKVDEKSSVPHDPNNRKVDEKSSVLHDPNNGKINEKSSVPHDPNNRKINEKSSVPHDPNNRKVDEKSSVSVSQHSQKHSQNQGKEQSQNLLNKPSQNQKEELSVPCKSYPSDWKDMQEKFASYLSKVRPIKPAGTVNQLQKCEKDTLVSKLNIHEKLHAKLVSTAPKTKIDEHDPNNGKTNEKCSVPVSQHSVVVSLEAQKSFSVFTKKFVNVGKTLKLPASSTTDGDLTKSLMDSVSNLVPGCSKEQTTESQTPHSNKITEADNSESNVNATCRKEIEIQQSDSVRKSLDDSSKDGSKQNPKIRTHKICTPANQIRGRCILPKGKIPVMLCMSGENRIDVVPWTPNVGVGTNSSVKTARKRKSSDHVNKSFKKGKSSESPSEKNPDKQSNLIRRRLLKQKSMSQQVYMRHHDELTGSKHADVESNTEDEWPLAKLARKYSISPGQNNYQTKECNVGKVDGQGTNINTSVKCCRSEIDNTDGYYDICERNVAMANNYVKSVNQDFIDTDKDKFDSIGNENVDEIQTGQNEIPVGTESLYRVENIAAEDSHHEIRHEGDHAGIKSEGDINTLTDIDTNRRCDERIVLVEREAVTKQNATLVNPLCNSKSFANSIMFTTGKESPPTMQKEGTHDNNTLRHDAFSTETCKIAAYQFLNSHVAETCMENDSDSSVALKSKSEHNTTVRESGMERPRVEHRKEHGKGVPQKVKMGKLKVKRLQNNKFDLVRRFDKYKSQPNRHHDIINRVIKLSPEGQKVYLVKK